jgi:ABC-type amino acid transport substrate-binding protein
MTYRLAALLAFCFLVATPAALAQEAIDGATNGNQVLYIGVRSAASPFSSGPLEPRPVSENVSTKSGPLRAAGYDGYMVYICDEVLKLLLIDQAGAPTTRSDQIEVVNIDNEMERREPGSDRFDLLGEEIIDIICDPASINRDRVRRYAVSPPLFMTGIGYLQFPDWNYQIPKDPCKRRALIGVVGSTNAAGTGINAILAAGEWKKQRDKIHTALRSNKRDTSLDIEGCDKKSPLRPEDVDVLYAKTHNVLAEAFCDGLVQYYVGDLEIIAQHAREHPGCAVSGGVQSFTTDRYAIFANLDYTDQPWKAERISRFFEILNREIVISDSLLDRAYIATFGAAPRSQKLELFFWSMRGAP